MAWSKNYKGLLFATAALGLLIFFWGLGSQSLLSLNEGRRALVIKEMFSAGHWLVPTLNGELYLTKPPFFYWVALFFSSLIGSFSEWTVRLPSAVSALIVVLVTYRYTFNRFGTFAALFSVQILLMNLGFAMLARRSEIEMLLTALCFSALVCALKYLEQPSKKHFLYFSFLLLALAILTKGPVAMLFVTLPLVAIFFWTKDTHLKAFLTNSYAWLIFLVVSLSWYLAISYEFGFHIWATIAQHDMWEKMQAAEVAKPLISYAGWIVVDFLFLVVLLAISPIRWIRALTQNTEGKVLLASFLIPFVVFSLFTNKHAKYLLPIYPVLAVLLGLQLSLIYQAASEVWRRAILVLSVAGPLAIAGFYIFAEANIFAYRTAAFPQFKAWDSKVILPVYAMDDVDSRLVFYAKSPIKELKENQLAEMKADARSFYVLAENDQIDKVAQIADCQIKQFKPYLKRKKSLTVFGFGNACGGVK